MKLGHLSETAKEELHCGFGLQWGELQSLCQCPTYINHLLYNKTQRGEQRLTD